MGKLTLQAVMIAIAVLDSLVFYYANHFLAIGQTYSDGIFGGFLLGVSAVLSLLMIISWFVFLYFYVFRFWFVEFRRINKSLGKVKK